MAIDLFNTGIPDAKSLIGSTATRKQNIRFGISRADWLGNFGTPILAELQRIGKSISTGAFFELRRENLQNIRNMNEIASAPDRNLISARLMRPAIGRALKQNMLFEIQVIGTNIETGELESIFSNIASNTLPSKQQLFDLLKERLDHRFVDKTPQLEDLQFFIDGALFRDGFSFDSLLG